GDMPRPVALKDIRAEPECDAMVLVNNSRLSVQPVSEKEWKAVCALGGL
ncbi:MAG TPA: EVE domain-containing protein, partial [Rhizobiales bacterium]|nr:EVE domain-containing protein [Hyphomicrobiales bacterium]